MKKLLAILLPLALVSCFSGPDVQALADGVAAMDQIHQRDVLTVEKVIGYGASKGMPAETQAVFRQDLAANSRDFERVRLAMLTAIAELANLDLSTLLNAIERGAAVYNEIKNKEP